MTVEERFLNFLKKSKKIHLDKYDYSKVEYINSSTKIKIICPNHGIFEQTPIQHSQGNACPKCSKPSKYTTPELILLFKQIHGNKYDYSLVDFKRMDIKIKIICPEHGIFEQTPNQHIRKKGCNACRTHTLEKVINLFKKTHSNKYDYSLVKYINSNTSVEIICPKHGIFTQRPSDHKRGAGCSLCAKDYQKTNPNGKKNQEQTIKDFKKTHSNKYDYSKVEYENNNIKVEIICPDHGSFFQTPINHKTGNGCPKCSHTYKKDPSEIIEKFKETHQEFNKKYDYSLVDYKNAHTPISIVCPTHGIFKQTPDNHRTGSGCPKCNINKAESFLIELFEEYNINNLYRNLSFIKKEIDILIPDFKFGIEHNGVFWHSYGLSNWSALNNYHLLNKNRHLEKTIKMEEHGYQLFHIREDHLLDSKKKEIWKSVLLNKCGFSNKVHARKLRVIDLNNHKDFVKVFLEDNHLQGSCPASIKLGLQDPKTGNVYSIMTFGKSRFNKNIEYELLRFCNAKFFNVRGAASKLLKFFERTYKPNSLVSYANRDWSQGNLYKAIGFKYSHTSEPNYFYIDGIKIIPRQQVQKHKLKAFLEARNQVFNENLSERDNMINNGYRIYYDTGNLVYHKRY